MSDNNQVALELAHAKYFTVPERLDRERCIKTIRENENAFIAVMKALIEIKKKNLYRPYQNMDQFCRSIFGWSERRTEQVLRSAKAVMTLPASTAPLVTNERQARALEIVPEKQRPKVLEDAVKFHSKDGKLTARAIDESANIEKALEGPRDLHDRVIEGPAVEFWNRRDEIKEAMGHLSALKIFFENIEARDPLYHRLWPVKNMCDEVKGFYGALVGILPKYVCGYCDGKTVKDGKTCTGCNGTGLLSAHHNRQTPRELRSNARTRS